MKKHLLILLALILCLNSYSQISFEKGYYINNANQKTECLIKNVDWKNNPTEFEYRLSESSEANKATISSVQEFGVYNISKYIRRTVNIDRSSENINNLSNDRNPIFKKEELFLKVLIEGKSNLYEYNDLNLKRFFYSSQNAKVEQLIFKSYKTPDNSIGKNNRYKQQLWTDLKCPDFKMSKIESVAYNKNDLVKYFTDYSECFNKDLTYFESKQKGHSFNLNIRPRLNSSSLSISNNNFKTINFDNELAFGIGLEAEFILPFNKNKWAIAIEPTYQNYKSEKITDITNMVGGKIIANIDYSSIEIPVSLRHYFFINKNSKIFLNASFVLDFSSNSSVELTRFDGTLYKSLEIKTRNNVALGIGYKQNDKYSLEVRYQTNREILGDDPSWISKYNTLSFILGYTIF
ncbi:tRNA modification GTPase [Xanthomarina sp.]|uniref:tRNA modification GTPase n=1 Tax=Xanthomarina sp. TaxID=1931211 RepID=UPI002C38D294|nr:tRNA modification GTPase [Xanthomarina sp.]HLV38438.1 hypothetical protein [Xanthomarina sp.]